MSETRKPDELPGAEIGVDDAMVEMAAAVADRTPVDWAAAESKAPERIGFLLRLQRIAEMQEAHARLSAPPSTEPALFTWGRLEVRERIGEGSFAEVYRAWDPTLAREVALKLRREGVASAIDDRRWIEEARRLARVRHPNVLVIHGADIHDGRAGLWTELLAGRTLEQWVTSEGSLGPREAQVVGLDLCAALAAVHAAGLVHGDVSTRNVMREGRSGMSDGSGRIVLMDFGSAEDHGRPGLTAVGTPLYAAPELLDGEPPSARSDVYALGVVLYRLLTARYPIEGASISLIRERLRERRRFALRDARPDLPAGLVRVVERAAALDASERYASVAELERALGAALDPGKPAPVRVAPPAIAAVILAVLVAGAMLWMSRPPASTPGGEPPTISRSDDGGTATTTPAVSGQAPPAGAPAPMRVEASLIRSTGGSREALSTGDMVAPGDALSLEVETSRPAHVYVLNEDGKGQVFALFPLGGRGLSNPLPPGRRHHLPGAEDGRALDWQVTSAGGREAILVLVSDAPVPAVEQAIAAMPNPIPGAEVTYPALAADALAKLRGVGGLTRGSPLRADPVHGILSSLASDLSRREGTPIWVRLIELENPAP